MEKLFNTYVDSDFLKAFLSKKTGFDIEESGEELNIWRSLLKFYRKNTKICLQLKSISFKELAYNFDSSLVKEMLNKYSQGSDDIKINENFDDIELSDNNLLQHLSFVFGDQKIPLNQIALKHGIPYISSDEIFTEWGKYHAPHTIGIPRRKRPNTATLGWENLKLPKHVCNSLIICDNYLLGNEIRMRNNLLPILDLIMPMKDLNISFDVTIFSSQFYNCFDQKNKWFKEPNCKDIEIIHHEILEYINLDLNLQNINLTLIFKKLSEYHDRHLFTNGFVFKSGNSFTYFGTNGTPILPSETTLDVQPLTAENKNSCYAEIYASFLSELNEIMLNSSIYYGSKKNRLFSNVGNL